MGEETTTEDGCRESVVECGMPAHPWEQVVLPDGDTYLMRPMDGVGGVTVTDYCGYDAMSVTRTYAPIVARYLLRFAETGSLLGQPAATTPGAGGQE